MNEPALFDPLIIDELRRANLFTSTLTVVENTGPATIVPGGQPQYTYADLTAHVNLPCRKSPAGANTQQELDLFALNVVVWDILLDDHYPAITKAKVDDGRQRVDMDGDRYKVRRVDHFEGIVTRMVLWREG